MTPSTPILLLTRPRAASDAFAGALEAAGIRLESIVAPVFELESVPFEAPGAWEEAIFTSARAVAEAGPGEGRRAWCVGAVTAGAAEAAGFAAREAGGDVEALLDAILTVRPEAALCHFRGQSSVGDVAARLRDAGLTCAERIVYHKAPCDLTAEARAALSGKRPVILPLFSPETVSILAESGPFRAPLRCICMSGAVAERAKTLLQPAETVVAERPERSEMVAAIRSAIA